jgi:cardiolipin synthase
MPPDLIDDAVFERSEENKQSLFHKGFNLRLWLMERFIDVFYNTTGEAKSASQNPNSIVDKIRRHKNITLEDGVIKRDHSKYYIFDSRALILGGMNIEDRNVYSDVSGQIWNDYMVELEGRIYVHRLKKNLSGRPNAGRLRFVSNSRDKEIKNKMIELLDTARRSVFIQMAYFGDRDMTDKIIETANRGVKTTIILPKTPNIQKDLNYKIMQQVILKTGKKVQVFLCKNMLHAKMLDIDENRILLGSANMNRQALYKLSELDIITSGDVGLNNDIRRSIRKHIKISEHVKDITTIRYNPIRAFLESLFC